MTALVGLLGLAGGLTMIFLVSKYKNKLNTKVRLSKFTKKKKGDMDSGINDYLKERSGILTLLAVSISVVAAVVSYELNPITSLLLILSLGLIFTILMELSFFTSMPNPYRYFIVGFAFTLIALFTTTLLNHFDGILMYFFDITAIYILLQVVSHQFPRLAIRNFNPKLNIILTQIIILILVIFLCQNSILRLINNLS